MILVVTAANIVCYPNLFHFGYKYATKDGAGNAHHLKSSCNNS